MERMKKNKSRLISLVLPLVTSEDDSSTSKLSISMLLLVLGILGFYFYKLVLVDQMGFCSKQMKFVSDDKLILNHLDELMKSGRMKLDAADGSPQAYLARHPNCCSVGWGHGPFVLTSVTVIVIYEMSEDEKKRLGVSSNSYYESIAYDTACGETLKTIGTSTVSETLQGIGISANVPITRKPAFNP